MKLVTTVPESYSTIPRLWPPMLPLDLAILAEDGEPLTVLDNRLYRFELDVVKKEYEALNPRPTETYLWATPESYPHLDEYRKAFPEAEVLGFPDGWIPDLNPKKLRSSVMPLPNLAVLPLQVYYGNCKIQLTPETMTLQRSIAVDFNYNGSLVSAKRACEILHSLRLKYCFEFAYIENDLTANRYWTESFLKRLDDEELTRLFLFSCRGNVKNIDGYAVQRLRDAGCVAIDFGEIDTTVLGSQPYSIRLPAAVECIRHAGLQPVLVPTLGMPDTTAQDAVKTTELLKAYKINESVRGIGTSKFTALMAKSDDKTKLLLDLALRRANLTQWDDTTWYGLMRLMDLGETEKIANVHVPTGGFLEV